MCWEVPSGFQIKSGIIKLSAIENQSWYYIKSVIDSRTFGCRPMTIITYVELFKNWCVTNYLLSVPT